MRKIVVLTFVTLDGVMGVQMGHPFDLLLGRRTYDTFAGAWPKIDPSSPINHWKKYVVTHRPIPEETAIWKNSVRIDSDVADKIRMLKREEGPNIQAHGSSNLIQTLLRHDLVDELWLKIYPITVGACGPGCATRVPVPTTTVRAVPG